MGGSVERPIVTEVEIIEEKNIGKGLKGFSFKTPKGSLKICESITGAIVGDTFAEVKKDIKAASIITIRKQIEDAKETLKSGSRQNMTNERFFTFYKY